MAYKKGYKCTHGRPVCAECVEVEDAARRMSEDIKLAVVFHPFQEVIHSFMAFRLDNGSSDHTLYPSKNAAIDHQHGREQDYAYICLKNFPGGVREKDAQLMLDLHRYAYDTGQRFYDRDSPSLILPQAKDQLITRKTYVKPGEFD
jgi:hypothetical protein